MIIVSKFHDYYDRAMSYGIDKRLRFIRKLCVIENLFEMPENLTEMLKGLPDIYSHWNNYNQLSIRPFIVILCGQVHLGYHFYNLKDPSYKHRISYPTDPDIYVYELFSLEKVLKKYDKEEYERFIKKRERKISSIFGASFSHESMEEIFKRFENKKIDIGLHLDEESPILFIGHKNRNTIYKKNPILREIQFYKKVNAFTAFQNISVFIGGVVSKSFPPTVELSEKERIGKAGFDKWSFRKKGKNSK